jgi:hypothetical protein
MIFKSFPFPSIFAFDFPFSLKDLVNHQASMFSQLCKHIVGKLSAFVKTPLPEASIMGIDI